MTDDILVTPGSSGKTFRAEEIASKHYQVIKFVYGAAVAPSIGAGAVDAGTPRFTLASDDPVVARLQAARGYGFKASATRPSGATPIDAGDVIGPTGGGTAAFQFTGVGPAGGGEVLITRVTLEIDISAVPSGMAAFRLYLFNVTPPSALADGAAFVMDSGDRAAFLDYIDITVPIDHGSTLFVSIAPTNMQITMASANLFGYLQAVAGWTPAGSEVINVTVHTAGL